jgi:hypothetical protein
MKRQTNLLKEKAKYSRTRLTNGTDTDVQGTVQSVTK